MHGMIGKNRKGRKRKSGYREPSGRAMRIEVNYREMAALQPHRRDLPENIRTSERAESVIGKLNLLKVLDEQQYEAGRRFAVITGAFRAAIQVPRTTGGNGRGYPCLPGYCLINSEHCECEQRIRRFNECVSVLMHVSQRSYNQVYRTAVSDEVCDLDNMPHLIWGLNALVRYFGLTNRR